MREQTTIKVGPIIKWPADAKLSPLIGEMQRLNPSLNLRLGVRRRAESESEYLIYDGTANDVFLITMPEKEIPSNDLMSGLTEVNRESYSVATEFGTFHTGPRRIERTAEGNLLIRPRSWNAEAAADHFNLAWQGFHDEDSDDNHQEISGNIGRFVPRWGIFREQHEMWEVDFAFLPEYFAVGSKDGKIIHDPRRPRGDQEYWRTTPVGTISYIDRHDLPIEDHYARARAILSAGSEFAIVGDVERGEVRVFRLSGVETFSENFKIPEMPWFNIPIGRIAQS